MSDIPIVSSKRARAMTRAHAWESMGILLQAHGLLGPPHISLTDCPCEVAQKFRHYEKINEELRDAPSTVTPG